jgi:hypothetical protein
MAKKSRKQNKRKTVRNSRSRAKKIEHVGLKTLGETDIIAGALLTVLGGVVVTLPHANNVLITTGSVIVMIGIILTGFGLGDYVNSRK